MSRHVAKNIQINMPHILNCVYAANRFNSSAFLIWKKKMLFYCWDSWISHSKFEQMRVIYNSAGASPSN